MLRVAAQCVELQWLITHGVIASVKAQSVMFNSDVQAPG